MKPVKPWERVATGTSSQSLLTALDSQATGLESPPLPAEAAQQISLEKEMAAATASPNSQNTTPGVSAAAGGGASALNSTTGLGGLGSSLSSPYSSLGMGGFGGMGGMGMYGGLGGMGGMGMYGGMGMMGMDQNSSFFQSMQFMQSMGFVVNSMCEVVRMLESNTQGLIHLWEALVGIVKKSKDWLIGVGVATKEKIFRWVFRAMVALRLAERDPADVEEPKTDEKTAQEVMDCMTEEEKQELKNLKMKKKVYRMLMKCGLIVMGICLLYFYKKGRLIKHTVVEAAAVIAAPAVAATAADPFAAAFNSAN